MSSRGAPADAARLTPGQWVRALRGALHMTQAQLARRAGVSQAHVALIEAGRVDPQVGTLRKVFDALFCDMVVLPAPRERPADTVARRIEEVARSKAHKGALFDDPNARIWD